MRACRGFAVPSGASELPQLSDRVPVDSVRGSGAPRRVSDPLPVQGPSCNHPRVSLQSLSTAGELKAANELAWTLWRTAAGDAGVGEWLRARGLDPVSVESASWAPGWTGGDWTRTTDLLKRHRVPARVALAAGLIRRSENGRPYDGFHQRWALPVRSILDGRIVGFSARRADDSHPRAPKYLNSPTNAAYRKGSHLLGAWEARQRHGRGADDLTALVLCEGPFDAVSVSSSGPWAGISPCGTALTVDQASWVAALSEALHLPVVLAYDGDEAGHQSEWRAWEMLRPQLGSRLHIADLPDGRDPGDLPATELATVLDTAPSRPLARNA